jgi:hypothetical protein
MAVTDKMLSLSSSSSDGRSVNIDIWGNTEIIKLIHNEVKLRLIICFFKLHNLYLKLLHFGLDSIEIPKDWLSLTIVSNVKDEVNLFLLELFDAVPCNF